MRFVMRINSFKDTFVMEKDNHNFNPNWNGSATDTFDIVTNLSDVDVVFNSFSLSWMKSKWFSLYLLVGLPVFDDKLSLLIMINYGTMNFKTIINNN
jgi:hypothetical protein